jgi:hypothetical protein
MPHFFAHPVHARRSLAHGLGVTDIFENAIDGRLKFWIDRDERWFFGGRHGLALLWRAIDWEKLITGRQCENHQIVKRSVNPFRYQLREKPYLKLSLGADVVRLLFRDPAGTQFAGPDARWPAELNSITVIVARTDEFLRFYAETVRSASNN